MLALVVAAGFLIGRRLAGGGWTGGTSGGCTPLRLAVAPELVPLVAQAATDLGTAACYLFSTVERDGAADVLSDGRVDGWVPASSAWLRPTPSAAAPVSLARTPVVVAAPRPLATALGWPQRQPSWAELSAATIAGKIPRLSMDDPQRSTAGLLGMLGVHAAMGRTTPDEGVAQMRALTLRSRLADASADPASLLRRLQSQTDPAAAGRDIGAFPVTEQALWTHVNNNPGVPLAAIYPADGLMEADYPLALGPAAATDPERRRLATRLAERIRSAEFAATVVEHGFRPATAAAPAPRGDGLLAQYPQPSDVPADLALLAERATQWARYQRLTYQLLLLIDASGSMNDQVRDRSGALTTKAGLLRTAGTQAAQLFGLDTSLGLWLFATPTPASPPYVEVVPFGPLDEKLGGQPRREVVRRLAEGYRAYERAGTPLFETVLRGIDAMRPRVKPGTVTLVVVLTDGRDEDTAFAMSGQQFLARLGAARDPARPVSVFAIGYGADADMATLSEMARLTGGRAVASNDPGDLASAMAKIFLAAHAAQ